MKYLVFCVTLNFLFYIDTVCSDVTIEPYFQNIEKQLVSFKLKQNVQIACNITSSDKSEFTVKWEKNNTDVTKIPQLRERVKLGNSGNKYTLDIERPLENDIGNYSCVATTKDDDELDRRTILLTVLVAVKVPTNINVVEGEKLKIHCSSKGSPMITWLFRNATHNITIDESHDRYNLSKSEESDVENSLLEVVNITMFDRGDFICIGKSTADPTLEDSAICVIRVIDKYAALWPFLGICLEVFFLCGIICVYEKKRNKTELEESDTDQSPDQKNTPDHGGKDTNIRHRQ